nr:HTH domain-containing protein [Saccharopolyspora gloriosae]
MPTASSMVTSGRLLSLLSLLQGRRDQPGELLARRRVSERTVRRDVDRLRELGPRPRGPGSQARIARTAGRAAAK